MLINSAKYEDSHKLTALLAQDTLIVTIIVFTMGHVLRIRFFPPPNLDPCHLNMDYRHLLSPSHRKPNTFWSCIWICIIIYINYNFPIPVCLWFFDPLLVIQFGSFYHNFFFLKNKFRIRKLGVLIKKLEIILWCSKKFNQKNRNIR